jgi:hypothetical protein
MRDQLIAILDRDRKWPDAVETADAILAALPAMIEAGIPDLVWTDHPFNGEPVLSMAKVNGGAYFICDDTDDFSGDYLQFVSCDDVRWWQNVRSTCLTIQERFHDDDIAPLKAAANAHHCAQIMAAIGLGVE